VLVFSYTPHFPPSMGLKHVSCYILHRSHAERRSAFFPLLPVVFLYGHPRSPFITIGWDGAGSFLFLDRIGRSPLFVLSGPLLAFEGARLLTLFRFQLIWPRLCQAQWVLLSRRPLLFDGCLGPGFEFSHTPTPLEGL